MRRWLAKLILLAAFPLSAALLPGAAVADTVNSANWSGYAVHRYGVRFSNVSARWRQPSASCRRDDATFSAMWVGIGGFATGSSALEQIGTELDCTAGGNVSSSAWYELVPAPSSPINISVRPGDDMSASVSVSGHTVTMYLADLTRHRTFTRRIHASQVDIGSAEWILEAPSSCSTDTDCQTLPLADFGTAGFGAARAQTTRGARGTITSSLWNRTFVQLAPDSSQYVVYNRFGAAAGGAKPSRLSPGGSAFAVNFAPTAPSHRVRAARVASVRPGRIRH